MKITFVYFSYVKDEELLRKSIQCVKDRFSKEHEVNVYVYDDGFAAISRRIREELESQGVKYSKTFYPRTGNLLGPENLKGQTKAMLEASEGADILVKIDCDTLVLKSDWLEKLYDDPVAIMTGSYKGLYNYPMGHCYAIKVIHPDGRNVLEWLHNDCTVYPAWANCFEDYEIGVRLHRMCDGDIDYTVRWRSGIDDGFWLCDPHKVTKESVNARVISCGFGMTSIAKDKVNEYKKMQLKVMEGVMKDLGINN